MVKNKILNTLRTVLFVVLGILVLIFNKILTENVEYLVGSIMLLYAIDFMVLSFVNKTAFTPHTKLLESGVLILMGLLMILSHIPLEGQCIVWGIWSISREAEEIKEKVIEPKNIISKIINLVESIVVIVFSILLILSPVSEHHIHSHVLLLGFELILEVGWQYLENIKLKKKVSK